MICSISDFVFESLGVNLDSIETKSAYTFNSQQTIDDFDILQSAGKHTRTHTLNGKLIQQSVRALDRLHTIAEQKETVTLAFDSGRAFAIVITSIDTDKMYFLQNGAHLQQDFEIQLMVDYANS